MIRLEAYKKKTVGVFGLGKAGVAAIKCLLLSGATVYTWDDNEKARNLFTLDIGTAKHGHLGLEPVENWPWTEMEMVVISPGVPLNFPKPHACVTLARNANVPVVGEVDLLYEACPDAHYIGITGTNGKSTTTSLTGHIFRHIGRLAEVGANFGVPALALRALDNKGYYVLEMSSYQLDLTRKVIFDAAVLLNITPDHLDRHGGMEGYIEAKTHIFDRQRETDAAFIGLDDGCSRDVYIDLTREHRPNVIPFTVSQTIDKGIIVDEDGILHDLHFDGHYRYDLKTVANLKGRHNWQNIAAAYGIARHFSIEPAVIMEAVRSFPGLPHRLEQVQILNQVNFINDSKATNADAAARALEPFEQIYWIVGGRPKAGGIASLEPYFYKVVHAFLIGEAQDEFARTLDGKVPFTRCGDLETATRKAASMAFTNMHHGAVVLLSPACASFDQWASFEQRGDAFRKYVREIAGTGRKYG